MTFQLQKLPPLGLEDIKVKFKLNQWGIIENNRGMLVRTAE